MDVILDTCGLLSLAGLADKKLSKACLCELKQCDRIYISSCSLFEIALKHKRGQLNLGSFTSVSIFWQRCIAHYALTVLPVSDEDFLQSVHLPDQHNDPFDRIIIAQALSHGLKIVTYDGQFNHYNVAVIS